MHIEYCIMYIKTFSSINMLFSKVIIKDANFGFKSILI